MAWTIEIGDDARKAFRHIAKTDVDRITRYLDNLTALDDPRLRGSALTGGLQGLWRYRVGDYRVICRFEQGRMVVLVVLIGHRRDVYR
ncbi:type II toxin-antitoxin system RelE/ParE family toxin [Sphingorhabdus sp.]|uniref:type II toxin-antitoxin system RelE family toxin n=1 Tax=Sphingorhabdus sp. TaxID=1902408 RepID=UPI0032B86B69